MAGNNVDWKVLMMPCIKPGFKCRETLVNKGL